MFLREARQGATLEAPLARDIAINLVFLHCETVSCSLRTMAH